MYSQQPQLQKLAELIVRAMDIIGDPMGVTLYPTHQSHPPTPTWLMARQVCWLHVSITGEAAGHFYPTYKANIGLTPILSAIVDFCRSPTPSITTILSWSYVVCIQCQLKEYSHQVEPVLF